MGLLDSLPRLHTFGLLPTDYTAKQLVHTLSDVALARLSDVRITTDGAADVWALLAKTSNIHSLVLRSTDPLTHPATFPPNFQLTKLRKLYVDFQGMRLPVADLVAALNQFLSVAHSRGGCAAFQWLCAGGRRGATTRCRVRPAASMLLVHCDRRWCHL